VTFLPRAPIRGRGSVLPQLPSIRYEKEELERRKKEEQEQKKERQEGSLNAVAA